MKIKAIKNRLKTIATIWALYTHAPHKTRLSRATQDEGNVAGRTSLCVREIAPGPHLIRVKL